MRARAAALVLLTGLAACQGSPGERSQDRASARRLAEPPPPAPMAQASSQAKLAYSHDLTVEVEPGRLQARFVLLRDRCLTDAALACVLVQASVSGGETDAPPRASLRVRLPHAGVQPYIALATAPLPGEAPGGVSVREQATQAEDLTQAVGDTARRLAQAGDFRDRLQALAARPDTRTEDLIKIAGELSKVQGEIEELEGTRRGLDQRVDTELVGIELRGERALGGAFAPVARVWEQSGPLLGESAAAALRFTVESLPWIPLAALAVLILRAALRARRRGERARVVPPVAER